MSLGILVFKNAIPFWDIAELEYLDILSSTVLLRLKLWNIATKLR